MPGREVNITSVLSALAIVGILLVSTLAGALSTNTNEEVEVPVTDLTGRIPTPVVEPAKEASVSPAGKNPITVAISTTNPGELGQLLNRLGAKHSLGTVDKDIGRAVLKEAVLPAYLVPELYTLDSVKAVYPIAEFLPPSPESEGVDAISDAEGGDAPDSTYITYIQDAKKAWSEGYTGDGVVVGIACSGIDFGVPDLWDTQARVEDPDSPYYGWPVVFDPTSMGNYLTLQTDVVSGKVTVVGTVEEVGSISYVNESTSSISPPVAMTNQTGEGPEEGAHVDGSVADMSNVDNLMFNVSEKKVDYVDPVLGTFSLSIPLDIDVPPIPSDSSAADISFQLAVVVGSEVGAETLEIFYSTDIYPYYEKVEFGNISFESSETFDGTFTLEKDRLIGARSLSLYINDTVDEPAKVKEWVWGDGGNELQLIDSNLDDSYMFNFVALETTIDGYELLSTWEIPLTSSGREWTLNLSARVQGLGTEGFEVWYDTSRVFSDRSKYLTTISGSQTNYVDYWFDIDELRNADSVYIQFRDTERTSADQSLNSLVIEHIAIEDQALGFYSGTARTYEIFTIDTPENRITTEDDWNVSTLYPNTWTPLPQGSTETYEITGLEPGRNYSISVRAIDEAGLLSPIGQDILVMPSIDETPPSAITDLSATPGENHGEVVLEWTAPGDDDANGTANGYHIYYSVYNITNDVCLRFNTVEVPNMMIPGAAGAPETFTVTGLEGGKTLYFNVVAFDEAGNTGDMSNVPNAVVTNDVVPPAQVLDLAAAPGGNNSEIDVTWTAVGDDGNIGTVQEFDLRYSEEVEIVNDCIVTPLNPEVDSVLASDIIDGSVQLSRGASADEHVFGPSVWMEVTRTNPNGTTVVNIWDNRTGWNYWWEWISGGWYEVVDSGDAYTGDATVSPIDDVSFKLRRENIDPSNITVYYYDGSTWQLLGTSDYRMNLAMGTLRIINPVPAVARASDGALFALNYTVTNWMADSANGIITFANDPADFGFVSAVIHYDWTNPYADPATATLTYPYYVPGTIDISVEGTPWSYGTDYTIDDATGTVTFLSTVGPLKNVTANYTTFMPVNEDTWDSLTKVDAPVIPAGFTASTTVILPSNNYSFGVRGVDDAGSMGPVSNVDTTVPRVDTVPPGYISDFKAVTGDKYATVLFSWNATGGDGDTGWAYKYDLRYSNVPITNATWATAFQFSFDTRIGVPEYPESWYGPKQAGTPEEYLTGLVAGNQVAWGATPGQTWYFALKAIDKAGNEGPLSNVASCVVGDDGQDPGAITDLTAVTGTKHGTVELSWTMPGDDGNTGQIFQYEIFKDTSEINTTNTGTLIDEGATIVSGQPAGTVVTRTLTFLPNAGDTMWFRIRVWDEANNRTLSNVVSAVVYKDTIPPSSISDLTLAPGPGPDKGVKLTWTAPGNDGTTGDVPAYLIKYRANYFDHSYLKDYEDEVEVKNKFLHIESEVVGGTVSYPVTIPADVSYYQLDIDLASELPLHTIYIGSQPAGNQTGNTLSYNFTFTTPHDVIDKTILISYHNYVRYFYNITSDADYTYIRTYPSGNVTKYYNVSLRHEDVLPENTFFHSATPAMTGARDIFYKNMTNLSYGSYNFTIKYQKYVSNFNWEEVSPNTYEAIPHKVYGIDNYSAIWVSDISYNGPHGEPITYRKGRDFEYDLSTGDITLGRYHVPGSTYKISYVYISTYNITGVKSQSGIVRLGSHPDENLAAKYSGTYPRVLLYDSETPFLYDTVLVDLDADQDFSDEKACRLGDEISYIDSDGDGTVDLSGGMIYFISRSWVVVGEPLNTTTMAAEHGNIITGSVTVYANGIPLSEEDYTIDLVTGDLDLGDAYANADITLDYEYGIPIPGSVKYAEDHGLTNIVPRNGELVAFMGAFDSGDTIGTMYASTIVGQGRMPHVRDSNYFPVIGIAPDAKIMTIRSYGLDGWDFAIQGLDGVTGTGDEAHIFPYTLSGYGYDSGWDGVSRALDAKFYEEGGGRTVVTACTGLPGAGYGQIASPAAAPAVISFGMGSSLYYRELEGYDKAPNPCGGAIMPGSGRGPSILGNPEPDAISVGAFAYSTRPLHTEWTEGSNPIYLWNGAGLSACSGASGLALIFDAYAKNHNGTYPDSDLARQFVMSGADDLGHDVLSQGAGFMDVTKSVELAANIGGVVVEPAYWVPGDYRGSLYEAFPKIINDDTNPNHLAKNFSFTNVGDTPLDVTIEPMILKKQGISEVYSVTEYDLPETGYGSSGGNGWMIVNSTGFYYHDGTFLAPVNADLWNNADMMRVIVNANFTELDPGNDGALDYAYWMELFNWTDVNDNGKADQHKYSFGDISFFAYGERNRMAPALSSDTTTWTATVTRPSKWINDDGMLLWFRNLGTLNDNLTYHVTLEFYEKVSWDWISPLTNALTIPAGNTTTVKVYCNVPEGTPIGSYEGGLYVTQGGRTSVVPILINVAANRGFFEFGTNTTISQDLYNNTQVTGDFGWRYFFLDMPSDGAFQSFGDNTKLIMDMKWGQERTDIDLFSFMPAGADTATDANKVRYGPYTLSSAGGSTESSLAWYTSTGGPEEVATASLSPGLNIIGARTVRMDGTTPHTPITGGHVGIMSLSTSSLKLYTNQRNANTTLSLTSNVEWQGVNALAAGPSAPEEWDAYPVYQDDPDWSHFSTFEEQLASGQNIIKVSVSDSALILDVRISSLTSEFGGDTCSDLDLGVFRDENHDGKIQVEEFVAYDADADAEEHVKIVQPEPGDYLIVVYGFTVPATGMGLAHVYLTLVQGEGFSVSGVTNATVYANNITEIQLGWTLPGNQGASTLQGALAIGPAAAPLAMMIPVEIVFEPEGAPEVVSETIEQLYATDSPTLTFEYADASPGVDLESVRLYLDGVDVTSDATVQSTLIKCDLEDITDGPHIVKLVVADIAGNTMSRQYVFSVDTVAPTVLLDGDDMMFSGEETFRLSGWSDAAYVEVFYDGSPVDTKLRDGTFTADIVLQSEGSPRNVEVKAYDEAGNMNLVSSEVVLDTTAPRFQGDSVKMDVSLTNGKSVRIFGQVDLLSTGELGETTLHVNGVSVPISYDGYFSVDVPLVLEGENTILVMVEDEAGNSRSEVLTVIKDTTPPVITLDNLPSADVHDATFVVSGTLLDTSERTVWINGERVSTSDGVFTKTFLLNPGTNVIVVQAEDEVGNLAEERISVTYTETVSPNAVTTPAAPASQPVSPLAYVLMVVLLLAGIVLGLVAGFAGAKAAAKGEREADEEAVEEWESPSDGDDGEAEPETGDAVPPPEPAPAPEETVPPEPDATERSQDDTLPPQ